LKSQKTGKGDAYRKVKALLHTFVAGQKYGVRRDATRRFCFYHLKLKTKQNPGVAPPDGALLFYWPKRVSRKGPALRWAWTFA
jgi:hypothetical protein